MTHHLVKHRDFTFITIYAWTVWGKPLKILSHKSWTPTGIWPGYVRNKNETHCLCVLLFVPVGRNGSLGPRRTSKQLDQQGSFVIWLKCETALPYRRANLLGPDWLMDLLPYKIRYWPLSWASWLPCKYIPKMSFIIGLPSACLSSNISQGFLNRTVCAFDK